MGRNHGSITTSYNTSEVTGSEGYVGGLVGANSWGDVTQCYSIGTVSGDERVGGLVGYNYEGSISNSYSIGTVSGDERVGGLVGYNCEGSISNSYSAGAVTGDSIVGGLVGENGFDDRMYYTADISHCYSTGFVKGNTRVGGLIGENLVRRVNSCFWDIETSGQVTSNGGTGKSTAEMQTATTFLETGWDFVNETENGTEEIWWILESQDYPRLWWETE